MGVLKDFRRRDLSQIAAQHLEIERLRERAAAVGNVAARVPANGDFDDPGDPGAVIAAGGGLGVIRRLPSARSGTAPYESCS
ncbi:hypothetical protein [Streptomyces pacificus]|uniref:Uncharacterized protein n=1 Tax=Streptomyces pacificus TaxID=2705029 RepID=A0A6A0B390_9ACTN|nr:hypothetical protein [Streptomyces pacificus]GFH38988.1 hypothetical protein SCWH03_52520 [Streptomyces pacificus]